MKIKKIETNATDRVEHIEGVTPPLAAPPSQNIMPHIIYPMAVYTVEDLRCAFCLKANSVRREVRMGRLRMAKRCGRYYCLGQWVLQWLGEGELRPPSGRGETNADRIKQDGHRFEG